MIKVEPLLRAIAAPVLTLAAVSLGALACQEGPTDLARSDDGFDSPRLHHNPGHGGGGGGGGGGAEPTATASLTTSIANAGLYGDNLGDYTADLGGSLTVSPPCPRAFRLDLTGQGFATPFDQVVEDCDFPPRLTIDELAGSSVGDILGSPVPAGSTNLGSATNYYFEDGQIGTHNVIWQAGICVTGRSDVPNADGTTTTTWTISTDPDLTDPALAGCNVGDLAAAADLVTRAVKGKPRTEPICRENELGANTPFSHPDCDGSVVAHLDLTVMVTQ